MAQPRPRTFDTKLEQLLADATPEQMQRIHDISGLQLRLIARRKEPKTDERET